MNRSFRLIFASLCLLFLSSFLSIEAGTRYYSFTVGSGEYNLITKSGGALSSNQYITKVTFYAPIHGSRSDIGVNAYVNGTLIGELNYKSYGYRHRNNSGALTGW